MDVTEPETTIMGNLTMPKMADVRKGMDEQISKGYSDAGQNMILETLLNFMAPTTMGGGTMEDRARRGY